MAAFTLHAARTAIDIWARALLQVTRLPAGTFNMHVKAKRMCPWLVLVSAVAIDVGFTLAPMAAPVEAQSLADHFSSIKSMSGDFVQSGEKTGGRFFLQRPGKIRFNYADQSGVSVISDGKSLVVFNKRLKTSRLYSLSKTPLKLLLDNKVDFSGSRLKGIREQDGFVTIKLATGQLLENQPLL